MDRFVKNFIAMSIVYLVVASVIGVLMLGSPEYTTYRFVHSHIMMLGWVSMMIYGVGYHVLPRFAGRLLKSRALAELHFWLSNIGLVGIVVFYVLMMKNPDAGIYRGLAAGSGIIEAVSMVLFFYNMMVTLFGAEEKAIR